MQHVRRALGVFVFVAALGACSRSALFLGETDPVGDAGGGGSVGPGGGGGGSGVAGGGAAAGGGVGGMGAGGAGGAGVGGATPGDDAGAHDGAAGGGAVGDGAVDGDAVADGGCEWIGKTCTENEWTDCIFGCAKKYPAAFDLMKYHLLWPGCMDICKRYCVFDDIDTCQDPWGMEPGCQLCESIMFINNELITRYSYCPDGEPECRALAECMTTCPGSPPPDAPMPKGGHCKLPDGGTSAGAECCPEAMPIGEVCPKNVRAQCIYGPVSCLCTPEQTHIWACCPGATPPSGPCTPGEKWTKCIYPLGPATEEYLRCRCDGVSWSCE